MIRSLVSAALAATLAACTPALAWDAHGHRTITLLAIDRFESELAKARAPVAPADAELNAAAPKPTSDADRLAWIFSPDGRAQAAYQSGEPDRFRAIRSNQLKHENDTEHYIDVEDLEKFGLTLSTVPPLRYEYIRALVIAAHEHPDQVPPLNPRLDPASTQYWPGFLLHAASEHYYKLVSSFRQIRVLESLNDPKRAPQLAAARANVIYEMGYLSHMIGDAAQPLHTTRHHHGWVGENPEGFTTNRGFHAYIDTTVLGIHDLSYDSLRALPNTFAYTPNENEPWSDLLDHVQRSFDQVRPLYVLQKSGDLEKEPGKAFITLRLQDAGAMLGALYLAAWNASEMEAKSASDFIKYDQVSKAEPNPMTAPRPNQ